VDCVNHHGDYAAHLQWLMGHLVYLSFLLPFLESTPYNANVHNSIFRSNGCRSSYNCPERSCNGRSGQTTYVEVPLVLELGYPKLPFTPTFTRVSVLLTLLSWVKSQPSDYFFFSVQSSTIWTKSVISTPLGEHP